MKPKLSKTAAGAGADERDALILENVPLVRYHAYRMISQLPPNVEVGDLINAGVLGLMDAVAKFDPSKGAKFSTYADLRIRGAMIDSLRQLDWAPQTLRKRGKDLEEARQSLRRKLEREPSDAELCGELNIELKDLHDLSDRLSSLSVQDLDERDGSSGESRIERYADNTGNSPHSQLQKQELKALLAGAIDRLGPKERLVISLYYFEELTMKEVGVVLNVNESRVSQIHAEVIKELRQSVKAAGYSTNNRKPSPSR